MNPEKLRGPSRQKSRCNFKRNPAKPSRNNQGVIHVEILKKLLKETFGKLLKKLQE